jgi:hypothetical protein
VQEESTPKDARASTPAKPGAARRGREEAQEGFEAASLAFSMLVNAGRPERLKKVGELMDAWARRLS